MKDFLKKVFRSTKPENKVAPTKSAGVHISRKDLEAKAIEGAKKAVGEYRRVFERLAEYDRA